MKHKCGLCGGVYEPKYRTLNPLIPPVYDDNQMQLKIRHKEDRYEFHSYYLCPKCAHDIWEFVQTKQWTECGERFKVCDFCEYDRRDKICRTNCRFKLKKKMHARIYECYKAITNRLLARCSSIMEDWTTHEPRVRYMMLSRMKQDCDYYLGNGNRSTNQLWAGDEKSQIENMKALWNSFQKEDKPEWLTWDELLEYEKQMCN